MVSNAKIERAIKARLEYDADHSKAGLWLNAENTLTDTEYDIYLPEYFKRKALVDAG